MGFEIVAIRGLDEVSARKYLQKVVEHCFEQEKPVRIFNIRSQYQYALTTLIHQQSEGEFSSQDYQTINQHYLALPVQVEDKKIKAVIGIQSNEPLHVASFQEELLLATAKHLSQLFERLSRMADKNEQKQAIVQTVERICLEVSKRAGDNGCKCQAP